MTDIGEVQYRMAQLAHAYNEVVAQRNDLLAAAKAALDVMCKVTAFGNDAAVMTDALDALDAAIAKAEASQ
jgi:recombinational DNA repair ATPase RecF